MQRASSTGRRLGRLIEPSTLGLLAAIGLALVAAGPFLTRPGLPRGTDAELHIYRAAELGHALRAGAFYPRWAPNLYLGYGYPIFNYYAPLTYYLAHLIETVFAQDVVAAVKAVFVLGLVLASTGVYLWSRERWGAGPALVAAGMYTFAPYIVFIDPHARGDLAEHFAICILPWVFYAFHRILYRDGRTGSLALASLCLAALVFSHNLMGLVGAGLVGVYWLWAWLSGEPLRARAGRGALAIGLAMLISAFFWFPALLEISQVELNVTGPGHFDFREHFLSLTDLFGHSRIMDLGASAPRFVYNLGLAQWTLGVMGVSVAARKRHRSELTFLTCAAGALIILMLPISTPIWEAIKPMAYLQFPWRLLAPANLMLAILGAAGVWSLTHGRERSGDAILACALTITLVLALPVMYPPMWKADFGGTEPADIIAWERQSYALGTTSTGDFVPTGAARVRMRAQESLIASYSAPGPVDKVNRASLPNGASVDIIEHGPLHDRFLVTTTERFVLRLFTFYFPGWRAYVDGETEEIEIAHPEGFITVWVPEGQHDVVVRFEDTPVRRVGWGMTALGSVLLGLICARAITRQGRHGAQVDAGDAVLSERSRTVLILAGIGLAFALVKAWFIDPNDDWLRYTSPPGEAWAAQHSLNVNFSDQIALLGYDLPRTRVRSGDSLPVSLYWQAIGAVGANYQSFVHIANPLHIIWGQEDHLNPGGLPTRRWVNHKYVVDSFRVTVQPGTPPGQYHLNVGLYSMEQGVRLFRLDDSGAFAGDSQVIATIEVLPPIRPPTDQQLGAQPTEDQPRVDGCSVYLVGTQRESNEITIPAVWSMDLYWRAKEAAPGCTEREVALFRDDGAMITLAAGAPADYPFSLWSRDEAVRDPIRLEVTESNGLVSPGQYEIRVRLVTESAVSDYIPVGSLTVSTPEE
ncbi:MAG: hypothetical protein GX620_00150 [Chloroflexi bacterium]|nr:hypothetical protein [Chloroflexota bacterium]